jgi:hypothetical protein
VGFLTENGFLNGGIFWKYELSYRVTHAIERNVNITSVELKEMLMQEWAGCLFDVLAKHRWPNRMIGTSVKKRKGPQGWGAAIAPASADLL